MVFMQSSGNLGVDDASLEIVDPAKEPIMQESEIVTTAREKHLRERAEAIAKMPDRPVNMDFER